MKRQGEGTGVQLAIDNLPRGYELGGVYTTFVLWAISPDGHVDNLGEIKRSGSGMVDSKIDVTTPLQTFALIVTAEPHFLVHSPSRMVVMENMEPSNARNAQLETSRIQYIGNSSDYFRDSRAPQIAATDFRDIPVALWARQAVNLAPCRRRADAPTELRAAEADLQQAESALRMRQPEREILIFLRARLSPQRSQGRRHGPGAQSFRERREEFDGPGLALRRSAERTAATANQEIARLQRELNDERHARDLAERDALSANEKLRDARTEVARLRDEMQTVRADSEDAKVRLARMEGEKQAEAARVPVLRSAPTALPLRILRQLPALTVKQPVAA